MGLVEKELWGAGIGFGEEESLPAPVVPGGPIPRRQAPGGPVSPCETAGWPGPPQAASLLSSLRLGLAMWSDRLSPVPRPSPLPSEAFPLMKALVRSVLFCSLLLRGLRVALTSMAVSPPSVQTQHAGKYFDSCHCVSRNLGFGSDFYFVIALAMSELRISLCRVLVFIFV